MADLLVEAKNAVREVVPPVVEVEAVVPHLSPAVW
jgi:hypothetical protein